ncbi:hypothetical protein C1H46_027216 [Malus baccata]|uniref:peroxidase n=1 Tax=Malus baccata TaxID=106549 RepID=A0A540LLC3_MALBA|nr:hypothetical protein C1H46_027216 [Malus baccata]
MSFPFFSGHGNVAAVALVMLVFMSTTSEAQLSSTFYDKTCPNALTTIKNAIRTAVSSERRMAASLIRLHFHDCFVQMTLLLSQVKRAHFKTTVL